MNCDDVFVILTRGPFPSGSQDDADVERHLQGCAECYRLAEALRPNDAALRDATGEQEISALPGYWGDLVSAPALSVTDTADFSRPKRTPRFRSQRQIAKNLNVGQFAAAVALGIVLAAALRTLVTVAPRAPSTVQAAVLSDRRDRPFISESTLVLLNHLPPECRDDDASDPVTGSMMVAPHRDIDGSRFHCCSSCHAPGKGLKSSENATLQIVKACTACHDTREKSTFFLDRTSLGSRTN